jgi:hypothetical protein
MRATLFALTSLFLSSAAFFTVSAQTNTNSSVTPAHPGASGHDNAMLGFLSPEDQNKFATVHAKTLADHPDLQAQETELKQEARALHDVETSPDVKMALVEKFLTYQQNLRQAMLKEDPTIAPILAQIDNHVSQAKAKHLGEVQNSPSPTNAPATNAPPAH